MIERKVNPDGQGQIINNLDRIVKIEDKFLQVRIIRTEKYNNREELTEPMPRAKFINPTEIPKNFYYLVNKTDLVKLKKGIKIQNPKAKANKNGGG
ncbi:hypothetical protein LCGC14_2142180 [marine sediment metagenome]|uniref:Uncharacterized protein n=1 Tax=marine sediment metagenome TaxID=412755 RepID=A0A0F9GUA3_9ZZZZ